MRNSSAAGSGCSAGGPVAWANQTRRHQRIRDICGIEAYIYNRELYTFHKTDAHMLLSHERNTDHRTSGDHAVIASFTSWVL